MSVADLLVPNSYDLYGNSFVCPEFVKTNSIDTTDPERLLIGSNHFTTQGIDFGYLGSSQTYTFNGLPFVPGGGSGTTTVGAPVNATDNNVLQITGTTINAEYATSTRPGVVSATTQSFLGNKTFVNDVTVGGVINLPASTSSALGVVNQAGTRLLHSYNNTHNIFVGQGSGNFTNTSASTTALGYNSARNLTSGAVTAIGYTACDQVTTALRATAVGSGAAATLTTGTDIVAVGTLAYPSGTTGSHVICIGTASGTAITGAMSDIIEISSGGNWLAPVTGGTYIGTGGTNKCFVKGIYGITPAGAGSVVVIDSNHQLGTGSFDNLLTENMTPTLDAGSNITSSEVRGVAGTVVPITFTKIGNTVTMTIQAFTVLSQSGTALQLNITGVGLFNALYRPTFALNFMIPFQNASTFTSAVVYVTAGGLVSIQLLTGLAFGAGATFGSPYDISYSWNITP